jgi:hypothetical protein
VAQELAQWTPLAERVEQTLFADGTKVLADFSEERLWVNGQEVLPPSVFADTKAAAEKRSIPSCVN